MVLWNVLLVPVTLVSPIASRTSWLHALRLVLIVLDSTWHVLVQEKLVFALSSLHINVHGTEIADKNQSVEYAMFLPTKVFVQIIKTGDAMPVVTAAMAVSVIFLRIKDSAMQITPFRAGEMSTVLQATRANLLLWADATETTSGDVDLIRIVD
jgi:hypothetical protein